MNATYTTWRGTYHTHNPPVIALPNWYSHVHASHDTNLSLACSWKSNRRLIFIIFPCICVCALCCCTLHSSMFQGVERKSTTMKKSKSVQEHIHEAEKSTTTTVEDEVTSRSDPKTIAGMFQGMDCTNCLPLNKSGDDDDVYDDADFAYGEEEAMNGAANGVPEESGTEASSPGASTSPKSGGGTKIYHFAPFSDDIAANARIRTHWIPQYVAGHPHILPNHFRHAVRLIQEMRRVSLIDTEYLQPRFLHRATALPATHRSVEDMSKAATEAKDT